MTDVIYWQDGRGILSFSEIGNRKKKGFRRRILSSFFEHTEFEVLREKQVQMLGKQENL